MTKILLPLLLLWSTSARADILFIDFNDADGEFESARQAALARKPAENIWRIPDKSNPKPPNVQLAEMSKHLAEMNAKKINLSSVVISGHDGNGHFSGVNGDMDSDDLSIALESQPKLMKNVRSVLLWGCYTTNLGSLDGHWRLIFPHVGVFAGFDGRAPSKLQDYGKSYLKEFLLADNDIIKARDANDRFDILHKIEGFNQTESAVCAGNFIITPAGVHDMTKLREECGLTPAYQKGLEMYNCYLAAQKPECQDPPKNTDATCSPEKAARKPMDCLNNIRDFYNLLEAHSYCADYWNQLRENSDVDIPELQNVQALMFFQEVKDNLGLLHKTELAKMDRQLRALGAPADLKVSDLSKLSRGDLLKRLAAVQKFLDFKQPGAPGSESAVMHQQLQEGVTELSGILTSFAKYPANWHEDTKYPSVSLQAAMSDKRTKDIRVGQYVHVLEANDAAAKQQAVESGSKAADLKFRELHRKYIEADPTSRPAVKAQLEQATRESTNVGKTIMRDFSKGRIAEVEAARRAKKASGQLTPDLDAAYALYLKKLQFAATR